MHDTMSASIAHCLGLPEMPKSRSGISIPLVFFTVAALNPITTIERTFKMA